MRWSAPKDRVLPHDDRSSWRTHGLPAAKDHTKTPAPPPLEIETKRRVIRRAIIRELNLGETSWRRVPTPVGEVTVRRKAAGYIAGKKGRGQYANRILPTLTDPDEVWQVAFDDGTFRNRYIKLYDDPGTGGSLCIVSKLPDGQEVFINYIPMNDLPEDDADARIDVQRAGSLLFRRG